MLEHTPGLQEALSSISNNAVFLRRTRCGPPIARSPPKPLLWSRFLGILEKEVQVPLLVLTASPLPPGLLQGDGICVHHAEGCWPFPRPVVLCRRTPVHGTQGPGCPHHPEVSQECAGWPCPRARASPLSAQPTPSLPLLPQVSEADDGRRLSASAALH